MTLPWYPRDMGKYARDTGHLTMLEHGAYNLMLDHYYSTGGLPQALEQCSSNASLMPDHSRIYRVCKAMSKPEQEAVDAVLKMFFSLDEQGFYRNAKADQVIAEQTEKHENRVRAGKAAKLKQCSSNAPQTKTQTKTKTLKPPTPLKGDKAGKGVLKNDSEGGVKDFDILRLIDDDQLFLAKEAAPGWDVYYHASIYNEGVRKGERPPPDKPGPAFAAWCKAYRKGKKP